jgi:hypothetical protein
MSVTNGANRQELKRLRCDAINQAHWYNAGRPSKIWPPLLICI